jgi:hypothetical protein
MTYGFVMDVPAPIASYDALHAEVGRRSGGRADGMLLHIGRETPGGFQLIELWETKELFDRFDAEVLGPALAQLSGEGTPMGDPEVAEFEPRGLVIPAAHLVS